MNEIQSEPIVPGPMWRRMVAALIDFAIVALVFIFAANRWGRNWRAARAVGRGCRARLRSC
jgi:hypothetical protein